MMYFDRTKEERELITKALDFEMDAISKCNTFEYGYNDPNPYKEQVLQMENGEDVWEALEVFLETFYDM